MKYIFTIFTFSLLCFGSVARADQTLSSELQSEANMTIEDITVAPERCFASDGRQQYESCAQCERFSRNRNCMETCTDNQRQQFECSVVGQSHFPMHFARLFREVGNNPGRLLQKAMFDCRSARIYQCRSEGCRNFDRGGRDDRDGRGRHQRSAPCSGRRDRGLE